MPDFNNNQDVLQAIFGTGAAVPPSTFNTGIMGNTNQPQVGGQLPNMQAPLDQNPNYMSTIQGIFGQQQQSPLMGNNFPRSPTNHSVGRDSWTSGMGLDHGAILNNIGLGNRQNATG